MRRHAATHFPATHLPLTRKPTSLPHSSRSRGNPLSRHTPPAHVPDAPAPYTQTHSHATMSAVYTRPGSSCAASRGPLASRSVCLVKTGACRPSPPPTDMKTQRTREPSGSGGACQLQ